MFYENVGLGSERVTQVLCSKVINTVNI